MTMDGPDRQSPRERVVALFDAAVQAHRKNDLDRAINLYAQILAIAPGHVDSLGNLGAALRSRKRHAAAAACQTRAVALAPDRASLHSNRGNALRDLDRLEEALAAHRRAVELEPHNGGAWYNLGLVLQDLGKFDEAVASFDRALTDEPGNVKCRWDRSLALLLSGDFLAGFAAYESRWSLEDTPRHGYPEDKLWDGRPFVGRSLLVHQEQGFGDAIQFVRYAPRLKALGGTVLMQVNPGLLRLFDTVDGIDRLIPRGMDPGTFDFQIPMLSVPRVLGTTLETIPCDVPYLTPPEAQGELPAPPGYLKVGIAWGGSPTHRNDRRRSVGVERFIDLFGLPGIRFFSLQKGPREQELHASGGAAMIADLGARLQDFADTAAAIAQLDLVVSVDTAVVHLAGALGVPAWVLVPFAPDWRWMSGRDDSPWYPSLRLFRQSAPGDWDGVFERIRSALEEAAGNKQQATSAK